MYESDFLWSVIIIHFPAGVIVILFQSRKKNIQTVKFKDLEDK